MLLTETDGCGNTTLPMRVLTRYVLAELIKVFLTALTALTMLMVLVGVVREAANQSLPLVQVVYLIPYVLPDALRIAVPVTLLLATSSVYGRMSGCNEVLALKSAGISPLAILWPAYVTAFLLSLTTVWLNDLAVSWGRNGVHRVIVESVEEIAYGMLKRQKRYSSPNVSIIVKDVRDRQLIQPILTFQGHGDSPNMIITADTAELRSDPSKDVLTVTLDNAKLEVDGLAKLEDPGRLEREIPLLDVSRAKDVTGLPSWLALRVIPGRIVAQRQLIEQYQNELATRAAYEMLTGDFDALTSREWNSRAHKLARARGHLSRLKTEPHRRWSAGFSCLCFAWVGAPMAIRRRKNDFLTSFFLCFLPILIVYYPLLAYGVDGAKSGTIPPYAVWTGNVLLLAWGAWLLKRVLRY